MKNNLHRYKTDSLFDNAEHLEESHPRVFQMLKILG